MTLFGNLVPLDRYQISQYHKCLAIFLTQVCHLLQSPAFTESDSEADIEQLCHEGGAGLAAFLM